MGVGVALAEPRKSSRAAQGAPGGSHVLILARSQGRELGVRGGP